MPDLPFQLEGIGLRLVLLPSATLSPQLWRSHHVVSHSILFSSGVQEEQSYLLFIKMRSSDILRAYIGYFQNQLGQVHNCIKDASTLAFISGIWITHPLYKHLVITTSHIGARSYTKPNHTSNGEGNEKLSQPIF